MSTYLSQTNAGHTSHFYIRQKIESVTTLAGQTATLTVRLQSSVDFSLEPTLFQDFGTGGSAGVTVNSNEGAQAITSGGIRTLSWTFAIPSISGKAVNANDDSLHVNLISTAAVNGTIQWIAAQFEPGPVSTPMEERTIQTELALCQRYYQTTNYVVMSYTNSSSSGNTAMNGVWQYATSMRANPDITVGNTVNVNGIASSPLANACRFGATGVSAGNADIRDITADAEL